MMGGFRRWMSCAWHSSCVFNTFLQKPLMMIRLISCFRFSGQNVWFGFFNQECSDISSLQGELIKSECVAITWRTYIHKRAGTIPSLLWQDKNNSAASTRGREYFRDFSTFCFKCFSQVSVSSPHFSVLFGRKTWIFMSTFVTTK